MRECERLIVDRRTQTYPHTLSIRRRDPVRLVAVVRPTLMFTLKPCSIEHIGGSRSISSYLHSKIEYTVKDKLQRSLGSNCVDKTRIQLRGICKCTVPWICCYLHNKVETPSVGHVRIACHLELEPSLRMKILHLKCTASHWVATDSAIRSVVIVKAYFDDSMSRTS